MQAAVSTTERDESAPTSAASTGSQAELISRLTDILALPEGRLTLNERAFVADILATVMSSSDLPVRVQVAKRVASVGVAPPVLMRRLLLDQPEVARPLLQELHDIPEMMLVEAAGVGPEHRLMIADRDDLRPSVADVLLEAGEPALTERVLVQEEVPVSLSRIERLVQSSRNDVAIRGALLGRPELQPAQGFAMFWWSDAVIRRRVLKRFALDRTVIQDTLQPMFPPVFTSDDPDPLVKRMLTMIDRRHRPRGRGGEMVTMDVVEKTLTAARATPSPDFCEGVGLLAGVSTETATKVMYDPGGEPFSILCKSIGLSRSAYSDVLETAAAMIEAAGGTDGPAFDEAARDRLVETFDVLARDYTRTVLRYWDWRPESVAVLSATAEPVISTLDDSASYFGAV